MIQHLSPFFSILHHFVSPSTSLQPLLFFRGDPLTKNPLLGLANGNHEFFHQPVPGQAVVSPHLSAPSLPGTGGPQGAAALRQGALALGPGDGAGALGKKHGKMSFFPGVSWILSIF